MLTSIPLPMSRFRIAEARAEATESNWYAGCPEERCRAEGHCCGALRRLEPDGPRCYPSCVRLGLAAVLDTEFTAEDRRALEEMLSCDPDYDPEQGEGDEASGDAPGLTMLALMLVLATPRGAPSGAARPGEASRPSAP